MSFKVMANKYCDTYNNFNKDNCSEQLNREQFIKFIMNYTSQYKFSILDKSAMETKVDNILSKKIFQYLKDFFNDKLIGE